MNEVRTRIMFSALVRRAGGVEAAAAVLSASTGRDVHKSTISRKNTGDINISVDDIIALEDACAFYPMTDLMAERRKPAAAGKTVPLNDLLQSVLKECGEAGVAGLSALSGGDISETIVECREAMTAIQAYISALEAPQ